LMCGDLIVLLGPGDIGALAKEIFEALEESKDE